MNISDFIGGLFKNEREALLATYKNCRDLFFKIDTQYSKDASVSFDFTEILANIKQQINSSQISDAEQKKLNMILQLMGTWNIYEEQNKQNLKRIIAYCNDKQKEYGLTRNTKNIVASASKGLIAFLLFFALFSFILTCIGMRVSYYWHGTVLTILDFWSDWLGQCLKIFIIIALISVFVVIHRTKHYITIEDYWQS